MVKIILLCFNKVIKADESFKFMAEQLKDTDAVINHKRWTIEYNGYYVDFRPAQFEKVAGVRYDYFWSNNSVCIEYLKYHYKGSDPYNAELANLDVVLHMLKSMPKGDA